MASGHHTKVTRMRDDERKVRARSTVRSARV